MFDTSENWLSKLESNEIYKTKGFKNMAFGLVIQLPYRKTASYINQIRREIKGTPSRTLEDGIIHEADCVNQKIKEKTEQILTENDFTKNGIPRDLEIKYGIEEEKARQDEETLLKTIESYNQSKADNRKIDINESLNFYELKDKTVNMSLDDILVKKQNETRPINEEKKEKGREYVANTIVDIQKADKSYGLNAKCVEDVMPSLIAFLILNGLLYSNFEFFIDGASTLKNNIKNFFCYSKCYHIILDWYHLEDKCKKLLSRACNGRKIRNDILNELIPILWLGKLDDAIELLNNIDKGKIKNPDVIAELIGYFKKNREYIVCYALRKALCLRTSSNRVEKANDIYVAERQKNRGMSWSNNGSVALTTIKVLHKNNENKGFYENKEIRFKFAA